MKRFYERILRVGAGILLAGAIEFADPYSASALGPGEVALDIAAGSASRLNLERYRHGLVYVDFWASWCSSCVSSLPWLNELSQRFGSNRLHVITVNVDTDHAQAVKLLQTVRPNFEVLFDAAGVLPELYKLQSIPTSFLIDGEGRIVAVYDRFGTSERAKILSDIEASLKDHT